MLNKNEKGTVLRVNDFNNDFLKYISNIGIELGQEIVIKNVLAFDHSMLVAINKKEVNISNTIAANIFVEKE